MMDCWHAGQLIREPVQLASHWIFYLHCGQENLNSAIYFRRCNAGSDGMFNQIELPGSREGGHRNQNNGLPRKGNSILQRKGAKPQYELNLTVGVGGTMHQSPNATGAGSPYCFLAHQAVELRPPIPT